MLHDIYFAKEYGKLYEKIENGKAFCWIYNGKEGAVRHQFIKRVIPLDKEFFDIVTPYGYGGPIIEKINYGYTKEELTEAFENAFSSYCKENKIVSEFVRFHPLACNALDFKNQYEVLHVRNTVGTSLLYDDPFVEEFSKSCRKDVRRALSNGLTWRITEAPKTLSEFKKIYYSTMDRNNASDYYYFDEEYFESCLKYFKENILLVEVIYENKVIAAGFYFISNGIIHVHLSGTLTEYIDLSPAYILKYATVLWGKENGYKTIHYGGGKTNSPEDSLYKFKKKFGQKTEFEFYIGKKIWNKQKYIELCEKNGVDIEDEFFPAYRIKTKE